MRKLTSLSILFFTLLLISCSNKQQFTIQVIDTKEKAFISSHLPYTSQDTVIVYYNINAQEWKLDENWYWSGPESSKTIETGSGDILFRKAIIK